MPKILNFTTISDFTHELYENYIGFSAGIGIGCIIITILLTIIGLTNFINDKHTFSSTSDTEPVVACEISIGLFIFMVIITYLVYLYGYKDNITVEDFTTDFQNIKIVTDEGTYMGELRESVYIDGFGVDGIPLGFLGNVITTYSDKDSYIIAVKYDNKIHLNMIGIEASLKLNTEDNLKEKISDNIEILDNGSIELLDKY